MINVLGYLDETTKRIPEFIFESSPVNFLKKSQLGRITLCALTALTFLAGAVLAITGLAATISTISTYPVFSLAYASVGISWLAAKIAAEATKKEWCKNLADNIITSLMLPILPGIWLFNTSVHFIGHLNFKDTISA